MKIDRTFIAGLLGVSVMSVSAVALAAPSEQIIITYYSSAAKTVQVGQEAIYCTGANVRSGTTTAYFTEQVTKCFPYNPNPYPYGP
ncbi:DUF6289 family protein [Rhodanobacter sp. DHB23]|uniref:DUF6289 family protein n=1 Tax=Rhodanobacter sp. DHB23 TaxID=2775923 RepID=UPI00177FB2D6|nr:DUF6289 family protein [Rhodanobacter sp. DHB23]MBD8874320.1 hypothetical protein [Rhodanobacter sp. DHB23]